jgi:2',3'-cyclic-nucleotide 2'-phosphodiesterase (5'-nucleotidase family)
VPFAESERELGGLARLATAVQKVRATADHPVVLVDAGDVFTRGPWHGRWYGEPEIEALNLMGYDALCIGNNEIKPIWDDPVSKEMMLALMRRSRFPWLAANLTLGDGPPPGTEDLAFVEGIHPFVVRSYGPVRVGFLGLTSPVGGEYAFLKGWSFGDPVEAAKRWVPIARKECDVLIAVTHTGFLLDGLLAAQVDGLDAIVGGHSHTFAGEPVMVKSPRGREVPIVQGGEMGVALGRLDLVFEKRDGYVLTEATGELIPITSDLADDPEVRALLDRYLKEPVGQEAARPPALSTAAPISAP